MGWFWAEQSPPTSLPTTHSASSHPSRTSDAQPPAGCPMHKPSTTEALTPKPPPPSACPYNPPSATSAITPSTTQKSSPESTIRALNPLNNMPSDLSQTRESAQQRITLPTQRETSSIPRGADEDVPATNDGNWVYPSPQQMYNAMLRKGHTDTPADAVEAMVAVHNFLNEGAWAEIVEWERRFSKGLAHGWRLSRFGEEGSVTGAMIAPADETDASVAEQPRLLRFMGNSEKVTPKAQLMHMAGSVLPGYFGSGLPFDRHDWFVERRDTSGLKQEKRYVIDYYSAGVEATGEPVFFLDIRPALDGPTAAAERLIRWGRDVWWQASGGRARLEQVEGKR